LSVGYQSAGKNHSIAGAVSGLVIAWGNGPVNMLGSAVLLAAVSGYLARADPDGMSGAAQATPLQQTSQTSSFSCHSESSQLRSVRRHRRGQNGQHRAPHGSQCASITASVCPHAEDLLEQAAHYVKFVDPEPCRHQNVALSAGTVWAAVKPGCRSCSVPQSDMHTDFL
jgi:hypothetical protein